ncbi:MAG: transposase [Proteobacteria bacterium]|nr:transposase [Pseudomonadota bacterium]MBU4472172.1 transposase [Pseudomonadota bacterium]
MIHRSCSSTVTEKQLFKALPPFQKPEDVLEYTGRHTHRVDISNHRIISLKDGKVTIALCVERELCFRLPSSPTSEKQIRIGPPFPLADPEGC